ncbi:hypothetical protein CHS0354_014085 [Potamilus streckersoni]|uniref:Uncharacterized protein n=1 Tax=Potamilus streckersoni TaxID=2493646 RepID=A0AAE0RMF9_9BIVA|nr:hypothetical protein CHS0354_014085 [Potamilus streckersoni]
MDEESLERQAMEELLLEAKRGAERAKDMGALGWQKPSIPPANKRFLTNMLVSTLRDAERQARKQLDQVKEKSHHKFDTRQHPYKHERSSYSQKYNYSESYQRTSQKQEVGQSGAPALQIPSKWDNDEKRDHRSKFHIKGKEEENTNSTNVRAVHDDRSGSGGGDTVQDEAVITYSKFMENNINQKQTFEDSKRGDKSKDFKIVKKNGMDLRDDLMDLNHVGDRKSKHEKSYNGLNSRLAEDIEPGLQFDNRLEESLSQNNCSLSDRTKQQTTTTVSRITGKGRKRKRKKSKGRHKRSEDYVNQMSFHLPRRNGSKTRKIDHNCKKNKSKKKSKQEKNDK